MSPASLALDIAPTTASTDWLPTGLAMADGLPFVEWQKMGATLATMELGVNWWIGDWLNYGERQYGEKYTQAITETGRRAQTLMNLAWVASRVEISRRREIVSWSVHAEVAKLDPAEQDRILDQAEAHGWSVRETREAVQSRQQALPSSGDSAATDPPQDREENRPTSEAEPAREEEEHPEYGAVPELDAHAELARALEESERLQAQIDVLSSDDTGRDLRQWMEKYARLESRLQQELTTSREAQRQATYYGELLKKIRQTLGVRQTQEILPKLREVVG
jgi:hypothetical protein